MCTQEGINLDEGLTYPVQNVEFDVDVVSETTGHFQVLAVDDL